MTQNSEIMVDNCPFGIELPPRDKEGFVAWVELAAGLLSRSTDEISRLRSKALYELKGAVLNHPYDDIGMTQSVAEGLLRTPSPPGYEEMLLGKAEFDVAEFWASYKFCSPEGARFDAKHLLKFRSLPYGDRAFLMELGRDASSVYTDKRCQCRKPFYMRREIGSEGGVQCTKCFKVTASSYHTRICYVEPEPGETVYIWEPRSFPSVDKALEDLANKYPEYREGLHPNNSPGTVRCVCGNPRRNDANTSFTCVEYGPPDERGASHGSCRHVATKKWVEQQKGLEVRNGDATGVDPDRHLTLCG